MSAFQTISTEIQTAATDALHAVIFHVEKVQEIAARPFADATLAQMLDIENQTQWLRDALSERPILAASGYFTLTIATGRQWLRMAIQAQIGKAQAAERARIAATSGDTLGDMFAAISAMPDDYGTERESERRAEMYAENRYGGFDD